MFKISKLACILLAITPALCAQSILPKANVFIGYSYNHFNVSQGTLLGRGYSHNFNGWEASGEGRVLPFLGIVGDFSSHYGSGTGIGPLCPSPACSGTVNYDVHEQNYLFGPRVSVSVGRIRPFAQALFGVAHTSSGFNSDTSFATAIGGGVDWKLRGPLAWRVQGDYLRTNFFSAGQNNIRVSTGLVFRF